MKVFLGGTVNGSTWRQYVIPRLKIDYFDPVVDDWNEEAYQRELHERKHCDYVLYVLTPKMTGYYSIAEVTDDSYKRPDRTIFSYLLEDEGKKFDKHQSQALKLLSQRVEKNGAIWLSSLDKVVDFLNSGTELKPVDALNPNHVFVSYGRKHSRNFAIKLSNNLREHGYNVWLDQNQVPIGVDFEDHIEEGIQTAQSFIFIASPHAVRSEYCRREIDLAIKYKKPIVPLLHIELKEDWEKLHPKLQKYSWIDFVEKKNKFNIAFNILNGFLKKNTTNRNSKNK